MRHSTLVLLLCAVLAVVALAACTAPVRAVEVINAPSAAPSDAVAAASTQPPDFVATDQWQVVQPGQAVPPGLWVRMDMSTGIRTARLLPEEERNDAARKRDAAAASPTADGVHSVVQQQLASPSQPDSDGGAGSLVLVPGAAEQQDASSSGPLIREIAAPSEQEASRGGEPLQGSDADLLAARAARLRSLQSNFYLKEDVETMKQLLAACVDPESDVRTVREALEVLEELVHQVDNANDFATIGGMDVVLTILQQQQQQHSHTEQQVQQHSQADVRDPNATSSLSSPTSSETALSAPLDLQAYRLSQLQASAAWVLGTAAQNNRAVQERARRDGAIKQLTELLAHHVQQENSSPDSVGEVAAAAGAGQSGDITSVSAFQLRQARLQLLAKLLYALSSLLRNNARAQDAFHAVQGADALRISWSSPPSWIVCGEEGGNARGNNPTASRLACVTANEARKLQALRNTVSKKALALVHDLVLDRVVNAKEADLRAQRKAQAIATAAAAAAQAQASGSAAPAAQPSDSADGATTDASATDGARVVPPADLTGSDLSSPALFGALHSASPAWCQHLLLLTTELVHTEASSAAAQSESEGMCSIGGGGGAPASAGCGQQNDSPSALSKPNVAASPVRQRAVAIMRALASHDEEGASADSDNICRSTLKPHKAMLQALHRNTHMWLQHQAAIDAAAQSEPSEVHEQQQRQLADLDALIALL